MAEVVEGDAEGVVAVATAEVEVEVVCFILLHYTSLSDIY